MLTLFWRKVFSLYLTFSFTNTKSSWKIAGVSLENAIVERKNRLASKENIAVRSENTIPNKKRENVSGENAIVKLKNKIVKAKKPNVINYKIECP